MNEIELIRQQLETERRRAGEVAEACAAVLARGRTSSDGAAARAQFVQACVDYLASVLMRFEERDQRLSDLWRAHRAADDPMRRRLEELLPSRGRSREALERLEAALAPQPAVSAGEDRRAWEEFAQFFRGAWSVRRAALDALLATSVRTADWRAVAGVDADSILEERERYARVGAAPSSKAPPSPPSAPPGA